MSKPRQILEDVARTYKTRERAVAEAMKVECGGGAALTDASRQLRFLIAATKDGRFFPVFIGAEAFNQIHAGIRYSVDGTDIPDHVLRKYNAELSAAGVSKKELDLHIYDLRRQARESYEDVWNPVFRDDTRQARNNYEAIQDRMRYAEELKRSNVVKDETGSVRSSRIIIYDSEETQT